MSVTEIDTKALRTMQGKEGLIIQGCGGDLDEWVNGINDMLTEEGILLDGTRIEDCKRFTQGELVCLLFPFEGAKLDMGKLAMWRLKTHNTFGGTWLSDYVPNRLGGFIETSAEEDRAEAEKAYKNVYLPEYGKDTDRTGQAPVCFEEFYTNEWQDGEYREYLRSKLKGSAARPEKQKPDCPLIGEDGNIFNLIGIAARTLKRNGMAEEAKEMTARVQSSGNYYAALGIIGEYVNITSAEDSEDAMCMKQ